MKTRRREEEPGRIETTRRNRLETTLRNRLETTRRNRLETTRRHRLATTPRSRLETTRRNRLETTLRSRLETTLRPRLLPRLLPINNFRPPRSPSISIGLPSRASCAGSRTRAATRCSATSPTRGRGAARGASPRAGSPTPRGAFATARWTSRRSSDRAPRRRDRARRRRRRRPSKRNARRCVVREKKTPPEYAGIRGTKTPPPTKTKTKTKTKPTPTPTRGLFRGRRRRRRRGRTHPPPPPPRPPPKTQKKKSGPGLRTKPRVVNPGELWVGGFAARDATVKSTAQLLWSLVPGAAKVAQPEIVALIRRGWRDKRTREWRAYAFARYRDEKEAETARRFLDGAVVSPEGDRVKAAPSTGATAGRPANGAGALTTTRRERRAIRRRARFLSDGPRASEDDPGGESSSSAADKGLLPSRNNGLRGARDRTGTAAAALLPLRPGEDPPEREVFAAWPRRAVRRRAEAAGVPAPEAFAATRHASVVGKSADNFFPDAGAVGEKTKKSRETYSAADRLWGPGRVPPRIVRVRGRTVPKALRDALLATLDATRWPSASHRKGVRAAEYLVLAAEINTSDGGSKRSKRTLKGVVSDENDTNDASEDSEDARGRRLRLRLRPVKIASTPSKT